MVLYSYILIAITATLMKVCKGGYSDVWLITRYENGQFQWDYGNYGGSVLEDTFADWVGGSAPKPKPVTEIRVVMDSDHDYKYQYRPVDYVTNLVVCKREKQRPGSCTSGFTPIPNAPSCYKIVHKVLKTYEEAKNTCSTLVSGIEVAIAPAHIININSKDEWVAVTAYLKKLNSVQKVTTLLEIRTTHPVVETTTYLSTLEETTFARTTLVPSTLKDTTFAATTTTQFTTLHDTTTTQLTTLHDLTTTPLTTLAYITSAQLTTSPDIITTPLTTLPDVPTSLSPDTTSTTTLLPHTNKQLITTLPNTTTISLLTTAQPYPTTANAETTSSAMSKFTNTTVLQHTTQKEHGSQNGATLTTLDRNIKKDIPYTNVITKSNVKNSTLILGARLTTETISVGINNTVKYNSMTSISLEAQDATTSTTILHRNFSTPTLKTIKRKLKKVYLGAPPIKEKDPDDRPLAIAMGTTSIITVIVFGIFIVIIDINAIIRDMKRMRRNIKSFIRYYRTWTQQRRSSVVSVA